MRILITVSLLCMASLGFALEGVVPTEHYDDSLTLDTEGNYFMFWNHNITHVTFEVWVKTKGYVGFGLSPNGNMFPADVVVGWVKDGRVHFKDLHTTGHFAPLVDKSQDWILLHGEENDYGTVFKFVRKLDTCDPNDIQINDGTQRVIYSYHHDDPADEDSLMYHGGDRRGTKSVNLLNRNKPPETLANEDIKIYDFTAGNYIVPDKDTTYLCIGQEMPDLGGKHHLIEFEPIYTPGNERMIHHLVIQRCPGKHPELHNAKGECFLNWPKGWPRCPEIFIGWATGGGPYYFPPNTGYPVGGPNDFSFMVMQIHYDNPSHRSGVIDNSGIRMRLTPTLRQHDLGTLVIGHSVAPFQVIPPHESKFVTKGYCAQQCLSQSMDRGQVNEIRVVSVMHHAHLYGSGMKTRHFRNGTELKPIYDDPNYDFYFQEFVSLKDEVVIKRGDSLRTDCTYTTSRRSDPVFGGLSTREEMCESLMYYYPQLDVMACTSVPEMWTQYNYTKDGKRLFDEGPDSFKYVMTHAYDWSNSTERAMFREVLENTSVHHECAVDDHNDVRGSSWSFEENETDYIPYVPPISSCDVSN